MKDVVDYPWAHFDSNLPFLYAWHMSCSGQIGHFGFLAVQIMLPKSMRAGLSCRALPSGVMFRRKAQIASSVLGRAFVVLRSNTRWRTLIT